MPNTSLFVDFSKQSPKGIIVIYIRLLYILVKTTWFLLFLFIQRFSKFSEETLVYIYVGFALLLFFLLVRAYLIYKKFLFKIDDGHFVLKEGIIKKKNTSVSFDRIQNVNFKQNLIQQFRKVYEVSIETAGSNETEIAITALSYETAGALKKELSKAKPSSEIVKEIKEKPLLKINFKELLKVSLTENHLQNLMIFAVLVIGVLQQLKDVFKSLNKEDVIENYSAIDPSSVFNSLFV